MALFHFETKGVFALNNQGGHVRHIPNTNLVFVHIPKTAGQAVMDFFGLSHKSSDHSVREKEYSGGEFVRFCCAGMIFVSLDINKILF